MSAIHSSQAVGKAPLSSSAAREDKTLPGAGLRKRIGSAGTLYAHALLIKREAVERYQEFAANMAERGSDALAALFQQSAEFEAEHALRLRKKTAGMNLPKVRTVEHAWLDRESPVPEARAFVHRMLTPRMALEIALRAQEHAKAFFEKALAEESDVQVREVAGDMARDEKTHIAWIKEALARVPTPYRPGEDFPGDPTLPQQL